MSGEGLSYEDLLRTRSRQQWERISPRRRAGVAAPLFSLYSQKSLGIGEFRDLELLADWCQKTGLSVIQLLPMNDVGLDFRPYDAQSSFALDPMYLTLDHLTDTPLNGAEGALGAVRDRFPTGLGRVNYQIKPVKLEFLWKIFTDSDQNRSSRFDRFIEENRYWLEDYALFKTIKEEQGGKGWAEWAPALKEKQEDALQAFRAQHARQIQFQEWLQWQAAEQLKAAKLYASKKGVFLMGDIPFLVSRDSADVWSHQDHFKLDFSAGAPPDLVFSQGQRWGMPPYDWNVIASKGYEYLIQKLKYAENFYDMFRLDHAVGVFRLWSVPLSSPLEQGGAQGGFDPPDEAQWENHGKTILSVILENSSLLPCAEDLGTVPACSYKVLAELGIPGMEVQRWLKDWHGNCDFRPPETFRKTSMAVLSTHDISSLAEWWEFEAGTVDEHSFRTRCESRGLRLDDMKDRLFDLGASRHGRLRWKTDVPESAAREFMDLYKSSYGEKDKYWNYLGLPTTPDEKASRRFIEHALRKINASSSIFSLQLLQDWISLDSSLPMNSWDFRINFPGTTSEKNWSVVLPLSLEELKTFSINDTILSINQDTGRTP